MDKEILLKFGMVKAVFSSGSKLGAGVIRMHELQTCEIPLLWCRGSTVWSAAPPVCAVPAYLDEPSEKARSPVPSTALIRLRPTVTCNGHSFNRKSLPFPKLRP